MVSWKNPKRGGRGWAASAADFNECKIHAFSIDIPAKKR